MTDSTPRLHGTTIVAVQRGDQVCIAGDGQVTLDKLQLKAGARKVRRLFNGKVLVGFAGATADAMTLMEKLESKLEEHSGNLTRAAVELAKDWRTDRYLRRLEAMMLAADTKGIYLLSGTGDVLEPDADTGLMAIGSGGGYALAAARALIDQPGLTAEQIARRALEIAADICIYTNHKITVETLP